MKNTFLFLSLIFLLVGCQDKPAKVSNESKSMTNNKIKTNIVSNQKNSNEVDSKAIKAIYFVSMNGGTINEEDLKRHPEIKLVHYFSDVKKTIQPGIPIWIDKSVVDKVDKKWLNQAPQKWNPIILIGYHNALYAFREKLGIYGIQGPRVNWSNIKVDNGFSIWILKESTTDQKKSFMKGYDEKASVENIMRITQTLSDKESNSTFIAIQEASDIS